MTYTICTAFIAKFEEKMASFAKKYTRYNGEKEDSKFSYTIGDKYVRELKDGKKVYVVDVSVEGKYQIDGYEFIASLEWDSDAHTNIIKTASSDVEVPKAFYSRVKCDHCGTDRVRKYTVLLRNTATGEYIQVGKSCVKDYLGVDAEHWASYLSIWDSIDEYLESLENEVSEHFPKESIAYSVSDVLCQTVASVEAWGYISKQSANENWTDSTSSRIWHIFNRTMDRYGKVLYEAFHISANHEDTVSNILKYIDEIDESSAYIHDLKVLCNHDYVEPKNLGLLVSAVGFYLRETAKKQERESVQKSEYVGNVGDKITFTATPECVYSDYTDFGMLYIYKFIVDGNVIIWKTSKGLDSVEMTIKATIKELSEYHGTKQTIITRGKVL